MKQSSFTVFKEIGNSLNILFIIICSSLCCYRHVCCYFTCSKKNRRQFGNS